MSTILDLQRELQEINEAVARAERVLAQHPELPSAQATLEGIIGRQDRLRAEFAAAAVTDGRDICQYAIETDNPNPSMRDITSVLGTFQRLFTTVYDALVTGPKQRERHSDSIISATALGFAYSFAGSVGVVMTIEKGPGLLGDMNLDKAMNSVFEIMKARNPEEVIEVNRQFGLATVRVAHEWASDNARARFGANVEWRGTDPMPRRLRIQAPEIIQFESAIDRAAEHRIETIPGELVELDYEKRTFQMRLGPDKLISGTYDDAVSPDRPARIPYRYRAEMQINRRIIAQGEEEATTYFLLGLSEEV